MYPIQRHQQILKLLQQFQSLTVHKLAETMQVSTNTIRNDIKYLATKGMLIKNHGGATCLEILSHDKIDYDNRLKQRLQKHLDKKQKIAQLVVDNLPKKDHVSLFMDSSTTLLEIAKILVDHPYKLIVVTNYYDIALVLRNSHNVSVYMLGGKYWGDENCVIGNAAIENIKLYHTSIALIGCKAVTFKETTNIVEGIYDINIELIGIKQTMREFSKETWICVDSSKFNKTDINRVYSLQCIDTIITDERPSDEIIDIINKKGVSIIY